MYYDYIARGYKELYGKEQLNKFYFSLKKFELRKYIKKDYTAIDIGCGIGLISRKLAKLFSKVLAFDLSKEMVKIAKRENKEENVTYIVGNLLNDNFIESLGTFDFSFCYTVIQDINEKNWDRALRNIRKLTSKYAVVSILKKELNVNLFESILKKYFKIIKKEEEEKDLIYFLTTNFI